MKIKQMSLAILLFALIGIHFRIEAKKSVSDFYTRKAKWSSNFQATFRCLTTAIDKKDFTSVKTVFNKNPEIFFDEIKGKSPFDYLFEDVDYQKVKDKKLFSSITKLKNERTGNNILYYALKTGSLYAVESLLCVNPKLLLKENNEGKTPLALVKDLATLRFVKGIVFDLLDEDDQEVLVEKRKKLFRKAVQKERYSGIGGLFHYLGDVKDYLVDYFTV
jgi:hypothetical protein